jgi:hypothetical protein
MTNGVSLALTNTHVRLHVGIHVGYMKVKLLTGD